MSTNADAEDESPAREARSDDDQRLATCTAFQRDILRALDHHGPTKGVAAMDARETYSEEAIDLDDESVEVLASEDPEAIIEAGDSSPGAVARLPTAPAIRVR
ncbi:MAG: hypothetical protein ABEI57_02780 [Halapricum sp.]